MWANVLAQAEQSGAIGRILISLGLMIGALVVLGVALMALRRRLLAPERAPEAGMFEQLRRMQADGRITPQEYDAIRQRVVSRLAGNEGGSRTDSRGVGVSERVDSSQPGQPPIG
jgi:hypothetical protein